MAKPARSGKPNTCGAEEARQKLPLLLERAHHGVVTVITRRGQAYAALVPIADVPEPRRVGSLLSLRGSGKGMWGTKSARTIAELRDEWE